MASEVFPDDETAEKNYNRLRRDVGASEDVIDNDMAEAYFVESEEFYPNNYAKMLAYARVIALRAIRASTAMLGKYAQNQSEVDLTKIFDHVDKMLEDAIRDVGLATDPIEEDDRPAFSFFGAATGRRGQ